MENPLWFIQNFPLIFRLYFFFFSRNYPFPLTGRNKEIYLKKKKNTNKPLLEKRQGTSRLMRRTPDLSALTKVGGPLATDFSNGTFSQVLFNGLLVFIWIRMNWIHVNHLLNKLQAKNNWGTREWYKVRGEVYMIEW